MNNPLECNQLALLPANVNDRTTYSWTEPFQVLKGSLDGNFFVVAGPGNRTGTGSDTGAIGVFKRVPGGNTYSYLQFIQASDRARGDQFGYSITINSNANYIVVGSPYATRSAIAGCGSVYIYKKYQAADFWTPLYQFQAPDPNIFARFGNSVSMSYDGSYLAVGSPGKIALVPPVTITEAGSVYIYKKSSTTDFWNYIQQVTMIKPARNGSMGFGVEISYNASYIIAGSAGSNTSTNFNVVFKKDLTTDSWSEVTRFSGTSTLKVGKIYSISSNAEYVLEQSTGFNNTSFVFRKDPATDIWNLKQSISLSTSLDMTSSSISPDGSNILYGSSNATFSFGAAWLYSKQTSTDIWNFTKLIVPSLGQRNIDVSLTGGQFGSRVSLVGDGSFALCSAPAQSTLNPNVVYAGVVWPFSLANVKFISTNAEYVLSTPPASGRTTFFLPKASSTNNQIVYYKTIPTYSNIQFISFSTLTGDTIDTGTFISSTSYNTSYQFFQDRISKWYTLASYGSST